MDERERALTILRRLREAYPGVKGTALRFRTPLEILIATMLSAQCTDEKVNEVTEELFEKYRTAEDYAKADLEELEEAIKPTGFYKVKAQRIKQVCQALVEEYNSEVPRKMEELTKLKGVARKTANIILSNAYSVVEGIAVDTHVLRLSLRLGLSKEKYRDKIERDLMELIPRENWSEVNYLLIEHGRRTCKAKRPLCENCVVQELCPSAPYFLEKFKKS